MPFYSDTILRQAQEWLCQQRKNYHFHSDVWHLRYNWEEEKEKLLVELRQGTYRFNAVQVYHLPDKTIGITIL